jgi:pimeloyl-ACP methyl ester carboxylesterase
MINKSKLTLIIIVLLFANLLIFSVSAQVKELKSADGVKIVCTVEGKGDIALLFIHGWCCNKSYWEYQIPTFSKKYQVVAVDLAGHGDSGLNRKEWTMEAFGQDVIAVVKGLKLKKVILIGHSMGGIVMVEAAKQLTENVRGLIGVDTLANVEQKFTEEQFNAFIAPMRKDFKKGTEIFLRSIMFTEKTDTALRERIVKDMCDCPPTVGLNSWEHMFHYDLPNAMDEVKAHIRCINSDKFPNNIEAGKRHAASFEVKFIKGWGHFIMMEDPQTFNKLLEETIQELLKINVK